MHVPKGDALLRAVTQSPVVLRAFFGFCVVAAVLSMSIFYSTRLNQALIPYFGWSGLGIYMFALIFVVFALTTPTRRSVYGASLQLAVGAFFGVMQALPHFFGGAAARNDYGNPYLMYSSLNPLFTVALPLLWIVLLFSPSMIRWMKAGDNAHFRYASAENPG